MSEPTTEAGRRLLAEKHWQLHAPLRGCVIPCSAAAAILAIEAEARADCETRLAALREAAQDVVSYLTPLGFPSGRALMYDSPQIDALRAALATPVSILDEAESDPR